MSNFKSESYLALSEFISRTVLGINFECFINVPITCDKKL